MKQSFNFIGMILIAIATFLQSCDKNFEDINTNPNNSVNAYPYQLMQPAFRDLVASNMSRNRSLNNELMQITVSISDGEYRIFRYDIRNTVSDGPWNSIYPELKNVKEIYKLADGGINDNASYRGISLIMQTWGFSILTDTYGDIPYSESLRGLGEDILEPKFDTQKEIYLDFFNKLDSANVLLSKNTAIKGEYDPIYNGNVSKWRKFGNSLFLRLLLRASG
ncbi:MAG: SusD/RagB family nutrient-binding outer membrane lipoprotein, partial [Sphingobacterium sp.]